MALAFIKLETFVEVKFRGNEQFPEQRFLIDHISRLLNCQFQSLFEIMEYENSKHDIKDHFAYFSSNDFNRTRN